MSIGTNRQPASTMTGDQWLERAKEYEARGLLSLAESARKTGKRLKGLGR